MVPSIAKLFYSLKFSHHISCFDFWALVILLMGQNVQGSTQIANIYRHLSSIRFVQISQRWDGQSFMA